MIFRLSRHDDHKSILMGRDTVKLCEMQGFSPRLENDRQSREEANIYGFRAEFAIARLFGLDPPEINVLTDGGVDLWIDDLSIDVKFSNNTNGPLIFDTADKFKANCAILVCRTEDPRNMKIAGWMGKRDFCARAYSKDFGYGKRLVVDQKDLSPIEGFWLKVMERRFSPSG